MKKKKKINPISHGYVSDFIFLSMAYEDGWVASPLSHRLIFPLIVCGQCTHHSWVGYEAQVDRNLDPNFCLGRGLNPEPHDWQSSTLTPRLPRTPGYCKNIIIRLRLRHIIKNHGMMFYWQLVAQSSSTFPQGNFMRLLWWKRSVWCWTHLHVERQTWLIKRHSGTFLHSKCLSLCLFHDWFVFCFSAYGREISAH